MAKKVQKPQLNIPVVRCCINCLHRAVENKNNKTIHYCTGRTYTTTIQDPENYVCYRHFKILLLTSDNKQSF